METQNVDALHVLSVPESITEDEALTQLRELMPTNEVRIERLTDGRVRVWLDQQKATVRPTLREAVGRVRWFRCCSGFRPCPLRLTQA